MIHFSFFEIVNILGTLSFAISGTSAAMRKELDIFGIIIIAFVTAIGGGTLRDILIGKLPVAWLQDNVTMMVIILSTVTTIIFGTWVKKLNYTLFIFDAFGLGFSTIIGIQKGMELQFSPGICIALGAMTGCFGGVIRDNLLNEIPLIFRKEIYASACILGGLSYYSLLYFHIENNLAQIISIIFIVVVRVIVVKYQLSLPSVYFKKNRD
jgi:uncharacterized membrane protein YeiH